MAEQQLRRPKAGEAPIKYGEVFDMSGEMAQMPISPRDAAAMESAETSAFGKTIKGGPASIMRSAASINVEAGLVKPGDTSTVHGSLDEGHKARGSQPWHESQPAHEPVESALKGPGRMGAEVGRGGVTIGEALQAAAAAIGDKPVDMADAAAIEAAEKRATGTNAAFGSGLGAEARAAATINAQMVYDEEKTKLFDIIGEAVNTLTDDKPVTRDDAESVKAAELSDHSEGAIVTEPIQQSATKGSTTPGGVAEAVVEAAGINQPDS